MSVPVVLTPFKIRNLELKNRIIFPSVCTFFAGEDGSINDQMFAFIRARAAGGAAAVTVGGSPHGKPGCGRPAISDEKFMARWQETADMVHSCGAKLFCQLHPAKIQAGRGTEVKPISEYDHDLIHQLVESYAAGAQRCMDHGVDAVEIHGGHAHEVAQFMSPYYNTRTDGYGRDWKRRVRFSVEIVRRIKEVSGQDFPLIFCISGSEMTGDGRDIYETALMAQELVKAGADVIHVSCGMPMSDHYSCAPMDVPDCFNVENAYIVREAVDVPIVAVDKIATMEEANEVMENGSADLVAMARPLLADPELVNKYAGANPEPPLLLPGCRDGRRYKAIRCTQNPMLGREASLHYPPAPAELKKKKILIAGAGPAGLEAACVLARRVQPADRLRLHVLRRTALLPVCCGRLFGSLPGSEGLAEASPPCVPAAGHFPGPALLRSGHRVPYHKSQPSGRHNGPDGGHRRGDQRHPPDSGGTEGGRREGGGIAVCALAGRYRAFSRADPPEIGRAHV